jgi:7-carboxy-7-deazaguanine synthase
VKISEIFYSVQGEGLLVGAPSIFVRTSGCNLRCVWCDTPYTSWAPEGSEQPVEAILEEANRYPARHAVVTGGEPMIAPQIAELTAGLRGLGLHVTVETAGTVFAEVACDLMSISPKLANSTPWERDGGRWAKQHERLRIDEDVLQRLMAAYAYQLKFVVERPEDLPEIRSIVERTGAASERVVLMPEGTDSGVLHERGQWLVEIAKQEGFRFSPRLHIELWGNRRGV